MEKLKFGRYDLACLAAFIGYALCSLSIPISLVAMGRDLNFPLDRGGMAAGGVLHLTRSIAIVIALMVCGLIAGRIGKRRSMGLCVVLMGSGILLCSLAPAYWFVLPFLLVAGFGEGICEGIATPFVQDLHADAPEKYVNISHSYWSIGIGICVLGGGDRRPLKPDPAVILEIYDQLPDEEYEAYMIGDSNVDVMTAVNADIGFIGCAWGFRGRAELEACISENRRELCSSIAEKSSDIADFILY